MSAPGDMLIRVKGLCRDYVMGAVTVRALRQADLVIRRGEFVMIVGDSGSGKSTLMHLLGCLDRPTAGSYILDGREVAALDDETLSAVRNRKLGFVFQRFNLLPNLTVAENIAVPLVYARQDRAARQAAAAAISAQCGLDARLAHKPSELSGGQCQRVAIARALVNRPEILFADEPTGNLDSASGEEILRLLDELHQSGKTVVMVTHSEEVSERAGRVVRLRDGEVEYDLVR